MEVIVAAPPFSPRPIASMSTPTSSAGAPSTTVGTAPTLSLIVTTLGRVAQVEVMLRSLAAQTMRDFDVTIVDQNDDERLAALFAQPWPFPLSRLHTPGERGASRGRNRGWRLTRGRTLLFPDDDCWYPPEFLARALAAMERHRCAVLSGRAADETGRTINSRFERDAQRIDRVNVWTTAIEWLVFFRRETLERVDGFDPEVGVGASTPWQSAEIQDILLRIMAAGFTCWYDPTIVGHHEEIVAGKPDQRVVRKGRAYARGVGYVLRLHHYHPLAVGKWLIRPVGGTVVSLLRRRWAMANYYGNVAIGRLEGVLGRVRDHS